jgi:ferredoxin-type protein NapG
MKEELNRRNYLKLNWKASIGFLGNVLAPQIEQERDCFRPPGAGSELDFLTSCTRCGECVKGCPEGIIRLLPVESGAKKMNTPYLDPNQSPCTFCLKCIEVCPTDALQWQPLVNDSSIGRAVVREEACIAYQQVLCDYCVRSCPKVGAIECIDGIPKVNETLCNGCGICVSHCINESKGIWVQLVKN